MACDDMCHPGTKLAKHWSIPVISGACSSVELSSKRNQFCIAFDINDNFFKKNNYSQDVFGWKHKFDLLGYQFGTCNEFLSEFGVTLHVEFFPKWS